MTFRQSFMKVLYPLIMLKGKIFPSGNLSLHNQNKKQAPVSFYSLKATTNTGTEISFDQFKGKKILIANTASDCGYAGQFGELEELSKKYANSLVVIGFPANDFKEQEKKNDEEIAQFCKLNYGVTFLMIKKGHVIKNQEQNEVFQWLSNSNKNGWCNQQPVWNFSKYIIDEHGTLMDFFSNTISPLNKNVIASIETPNP